MQPTVLNISLNFPRRIIPCAGYADSGEVKKNARDRCKCDEGSCVHRTPSQSQAVGDSASVSQRIWLHANIRNQRREKIKCRSIGQS